MKLAEEYCCIRGPKELVLANAAGFSAEAHAALERGAKNIVVDLEQTGFLDCGGIGALIALRNDARRLSGDISVRFANPTAPVRKLLHLTHLDGLLETTA